MPQKEWVAEHQGHSIRVTNAWFGGAKLYIDGECRDTDNRMLASASTPSLSARLEQGKPESPLVEVFVEGGVTVKAKICIDGRQISGDVLSSSK